MFGDGCSTIRRGHRGGRGRCKEEDRPGTAARLLAALEAAAEEPVDDEQRCHPRGHRQHRVADQPRHATRFTASVCSTCWSPRASTSGLGKMTEATTTHGFWELMRIARGHVESDALNLVNVRYGADPGVKAYSHVSDRFSPFATQTMPYTRCRAGRARTSRPQARLSGLAWLWVG